MISAFVNKLLANAAHNGDKFQKRKFLAGEGSIVL